MVVTQRVVCLYNIKAIRSVLCLYKGYKSVDSVPRLVDDYLQKKLKVDEFVTHTLPFEKICEGFDLMHAGKW